VKTLPKPLIVVIVIVLVLAIVSCGAVVARRNDPPGDRAEINSGLFARLFKAFAPPSAPVRFPPATTNPDNCFASITSCAVTIPPSDDLRRELRLTHSSGFMTVRVIGQVNGTNVDNTVSMPGDTSEVSVVVTRGDGATVLLGCTFGPCAVNVNP